MSLALFLVALAGAVAAVAYQDLTSISTARKMENRRALSFSALVETEVANVAQFGTMRMERLERLFKDLVANSDVEYLGLHNEAGQLLVEAGRPKDTGNLFSKAEGLHSLGDDIQIFRRLSIRESFSASHGGTWAGASPGGPGGNPSGLIAGNVALTLEFSGRWTTEARSDAIVHLLVTTLILVAFAFSAVLMLRATRRSEVAERQKRLTQQRNQYLEGINLMASGLAHEIKNPIGAVTGFAELLAQKHPSDTEDGRFLRTMLEALEGVNEKVNRLLSFARPKPTARTRLDMDNIVQKVVDLLEPDISENEVTVEISLNGAIPLASLDSEQFKEVVLNLMLNALDAVGRGGKIRLETRYDDNDSVHVLTMTDNGQGIAAGDLEKVFRPYFTTKASGSGLGLAICKRNVENHNGTIWIISDSNAGTSVIVTIPLEESDEENSHNR